MKKRTRRLDLSTETLRPLRTDRLSGIGAGSHTSLVATDSTSVQSSGTSVISQVTSLRSISGH
jgi:hypothetical protein